MHDTIIRYLQYLEEKGRLPLTIKAARSVPPYFTAILTVSTTLYKG